LTDIFAHSYSGETGLSFGANQKNRYRSGRSQFRFPKRDRATNSLLVINTKTFVFEKCVSLGTKMGHFQTEIGSFVCTKRQTCLSRLRICKKYRSLSVWKCSYRSKSESRFRFFIGRSRGASSYQYKMHSFFENCATLGTDLGPFQTESGYLVYTKR
jgi:hypothetical protein